MFNTTERVSDGALPVTVNRTYGLADIPLFVRGIAEIESDCECERVSVREWVCVSECVWVSVSECECERVSVSECENGESVNEWKKERIVWERGMDTNVLSISLLPSISLSSLYF